MIHFAIISTDSDRDIEFKYFGKNKSGANEYIITKMMELAFRSQGHILTDDESYTYEEERNYRECIFTWVDALGVSHTTRFQVFGVELTKKLVYYYPLNGLLTQHLDEDDILPEATGMLIREDVGRVCMPINHRGHSYVQIIDLQEYVGFKHERAKVSV